VRNNPRKPVFELIEEYLDEQVIFSTSVKPAVEEKPAVVVNDMSKPIKKQSPPKNEKKVEFTEEKVVSQ